MGFWEKMSDFGPGGAIAGMTWIGVMSVIFIWALSIILSQLSKLIGIQVPVLQLEPILGLFAVAGIIFMALQIGINPGAVELKSHFFATAILAGAVLFIFVLYPKLAPNLLQPTVSAAKAILKIP